jgi:hypothetical protein
MSASTRLRQNLDPILQYAPPRVREQAHADESSAMPQADCPGRHNPEESTPEFSGDRAIMNMQRRLTLEPELLPQPPPAIGGRDLSRTALRAGGLLGVAAVIAWLVVATPLMKVWLGGQFLGAHFSGGSIASNAAAPPPLQKQDRLTTIDRVPSTQYQPASAEPYLDSFEPVQNAPAETVQAAMAFAAPSSDAGASAHALSTLPDIPGPPPEREAPAAPAAPGFVTRQLDRADIASLLERADGFITSGDLSAARLLLERAAEAGDAHAAFTLAGTFDPHVLKELGLRDGAPDLAKARLWYERAAQLGSADAPHRLQQLATASAE